MTDVGKAIRSALATARHVAAPLMRASGGPADGGGAQPQPDPASPSVGGSLAPPLRGKPGIALPVQQPRVFNGAGMYSHAAEEALRLPQVRGNPQQMLASLKGVKKEELDNAGSPVGKYADPKSITREELAHHFRNSVPRIRESEFNDSDPEDPNDPQETQYEEYTIPGGKNYRELLLHLPPTPVPPPTPEMQKALQKQHDAWRAVNAHRTKHTGSEADLRADPHFLQLTEAAVAAQRDHSGKQQAHVAKVKDKDFHSSHWATPNVLAHLRLSDRQIPTNEPYFRWRNQASRFTSQDFPTREAAEAYAEKLHNTLRSHLELEHGDSGRFEGATHLEELQSDWGQEGRERGFKSDLPAMVAKRDSMEDGEERQLLQAKINLAQQHGAPHGPYVTSTNGWTDLGLKRALLEAARAGHSRLVWTPDAEHDRMYPGRESTESHEGGNKGYYDKIVPLRMREILKKMGHEARFEPVTVTHEPKDGSSPGPHNTRTTLHSVHLPPELRDKIKKGLPAFAKGGAVSEPFLRPAVRHNGRVYKGDCHLDAASRVPAEQRAAAQLDGSNRGWVNERGRFLGREAAQQYAVNNGLIRDDAPAWAHTAREAISENLKPAPPLGDWENRKAGGAVNLRAAGVMLRDPEDRVLFVKRNPKGGDHGGEWAFPGGKIEHGESPAQAAARETHEEVGHKIKGALKHVDSRVSKEGVHFTTFEHRVDKQFTPKLNEEHSEFRWAHPNAAPSPLHPGVEATLTGRPTRAYGGRNKESSPIWWHGSVSGDMRGGKTGLHLGTRGAAEDALHASIGFPAEGTWDGTREYGKTLLAGKKRILAQNKYGLTGRNCDAPEHDHYAHEHPEGPLKYSNGAPVPADAKPSIKPFKIVGGMTNTPAAPHNDWKANGYMQAALKRGNAKNGYYYENEGEDSGSISAVVPNGSHVAPAPEAAVPAGWNGWNTPLTQSPTGAYAAGGGVHYDTRQDGPFWRVARKDLGGQSGVSGAHAAEVRGPGGAPDGGGAGPVGDGAAQPHAARRLAQLQQIANSHARAHGRDPLKLALLATEANRTNPLGKFNPGVVNTAQANNDMERMAKEHGYSGVANPKAAYPVAALFNKTPVQPTTSDDSVAKALRLTAPAA